MLAPDAHLHRSDPVMARLIDEHGGPLPEDEHDGRRPAEYYAALVRSITGQQLSVKAAASIWRRVLERYGGHAPTPQQILDDDAEEMRVACGFSHAKVRYLRSLAEHVVSGELELDRLPELSDGEVLRELTAIKGIGEWTAHMYLMFTLGRQDVLPVGDLGVRNATMRAYGLAAPPAPAELEAIAEPWRPYRTRASLYLWRSLDNEPIS